MTAPGTSRARGWLLVLLSTFAYGAMSIFAKTAYAAGATSASVLAWRFTIATLLFALFATPPPAGSRGATTPLWGLGFVFVVNALCTSRASKPSPPRPRRCSSTRIR